MDEDESRLAQENKGNWRLAFLNSPFPSNSQSRYIPGGFIRSSSVNRTQVHPVTSFISVSTGNERTLNERDWPSI